MRGRYWLLLFVFTAVITIQGLYGQRNSDEYTALKRYQLPSEAIPMQELTEEEGVYSLQGLPFSGIVFERYPGGQLLRVMYLHDGEQNGPLYLWYPDAKPQMSAYYYKGRLRGRFLGWYANGKVIYDMMIGPKGYSGDMLEDETRLSDDDWGDYEYEGSDND